MMPSQEIHKPLIVRLRYAEQRQQLHITSARPLETFSNHVLDLASSNHPLGIRACDGFPEISRDDIFHGPSMNGVVRKSDVIGLNNRADSGMQRPLDNVFQLSYVSWKTIAGQLRYG